MKRPHFIQDFNVIAAKKKKLLNYIFFIHRYILELLFFLFKNFDDNIKKNKTIEEKQLLHNDSSKFIYKKFDANIDFS